MKGVFGHVEHQTDVGGHGRQSASLSPWQQHTQPQGSCPRHWEEIREWRGLIQQSGNYDLWKTQIGSTLRHATCLIRKTDGKCWTNMTVTSLTCSHSRKQERVFTFSSLCLVHSCLNFVRQGISPLFPPYLSPLFVIFSFALYILTSHRPVESHKTYCSNPKCKQLIRCSRFTPCNPLPKNGRRTNIARYSIT